MKWGENPDASQHPTDQSERPLSTYGWVFFIANSDGSEDIEACDNDAEAIDFAQILRNDVDVVAYTCWKKAAIWSRGQSPAADHSDAADQQS